METKQPKLIVKDLKKIYEDKCALNSVSFDVKEGEFLSILGPSGCGKTTILRILIGLLDATSGTIIKDGVDITNAPASSRGMGIVFQNYALFENMTVLGNVEYALKIRKETKAVARERALSMIERMGLSEHINKKPGELSGGQQQRVAIARALVKMPRVLLLDEPLSNLDARLRLQTREEIRRIQRETGITTIFVTHDQEEAMSISDLIVVMKDGVLQQMGKPQEVYNSPVNLFVAKFLGTPPINVFCGRIEGGKLLIGNAAVMDANAPDTDVLVGIRPEGFVPDKDGALECKLDRVEVMGRDISIVAAHDSCTNDAIRAIISAESDVDSDSDTVRFSLKPNKVYVFDKTTEARVEVK